MADPLETDVSQEQLWGLKPDAPPPVLGNGQPAPAPTTPAPTTPAQPTPDVQLGEDQRWGLTARPGQTREGGYALDVSPPPTARPGQPVSQQAVDDAREWDLAKQEEMKALGTTLSLIDYKPLPGQFTRQQHAEYERLQKAEELLGRIQATNPKEYRLYKPQVDQLRKRIDDDVKERDKQMRQTRREQLARDDAPYQTVEARDKTYGLVDQHVRTMVGDIITNMGSRDAATARKADYDVAVSPITTMTTPKPGTDPKEKPSADNRDFRPFRDAAANIATHNRGMSPEGAVTAVLIMGTPGGGTDEKGNPVPGTNQRYGMGATNYKVLGRDELDNVLVQLNDGRRIRVPAETYRNLMTARQQGVQRSRQWETDFKKSQEPGLIRRAVNWGLSVIPEKGF